MRYGYYLFVTLLVIMLILGGFFILTRPKSSEQKVDKVTTQQNKLIDYANEYSQISYTTQGSTNAESKHRSIKISVSGNLVSIKVYGGYQNKLIKTQSYVNNINAYKEFLAGLQTLGFSNQRKTEDGVELMGSCPLGLKHIFETDNMNNIPNQLWTTSCSNTLGTFAGNLANVQRLFQMQVPNYSNFVSNVSLR